MNMTVTTNDVGNVILKMGVHRDELLTFTAAGTVLAGTILARDSASKKMVPYIKGGVTNENGVPKAVLTYDVTATAAGDIAIRDMVHGTVRGNRVIIDADGDGSNIDADVIDQLRDYTLVTINVDELNIYDNQ